MAKRSQEKTSSRVNIVYDVPVGDAIEQVSLPFVTGVMADLSGKPAPGEEAKPLADRAFVEFEHANFDDRMRSIRPRVAFQVPDALNESAGEDGKGGGMLSVECTFQSMDDFAPDNVARQVPPLAKLLKLREQIDRLVSHLDGNAKAEDLVARLLNDPAMLQAMAGTEKA